MLDPNDVTTNAFDGLVREIADELSLTPKRVYEILGPDNPYPKCWRIFNPLGRIAPDRLELIRSDFNARCDRILRGRTTPSTAASLNKELDEAVQKVLERRPAAERKAAILEAISELQKQLETCDETVVTGRFA